MKIPFLRRPRLCNLGIFGSLVELPHAILHEDEVSVLVRSLLGLSLFDTFVQEVYSLFVLLLQLRLDALVLNVLQPIHLELGHRWVFHDYGSLVGVADGCMDLGLCHLPLLGKLYVVFIKNYFLNVVSGHLSHE